MMKHFLYIVFFLSSNGVFAQLLVGNGLKFEQISRQQGLVSGETTVVFQDSKGLLWIGGDHGISIWDGYDLLTSKGYLFGEKGYNGDYTTAIVETKSGDLFLGSRSNGLHMYHRESGNFHQVDTNIQRINSLLIIGENLLIGSPDGLYFFNILDDELRQIGEYEQVSNLFIINNQIIFSAKDAVYLLSSTDFEILRKIPVSPKSVILPLDDGSFWLSSENQLKLFDRNHLLKDSFLIEEAPILSLHQNNSMLWIGTNLGLWRMDFKNEKKARKALYLKNFHIKIYCITEDQTGNIFLGTNSKGLLKYAWNANQYKYHPYQHLVGNQYIQSIFETKDGSKVIATDNGLILTVDSTQKEFVFRKQDGLPSNRITQILNNYDGTLYVATDGGIVTFNSVENEFNLIREGRAKLLKFQNDTLLWVILNTKLTRLTIKNQRVESIWHGQYNTSNYLIDGEIIWALEQDLGLVKYVVKESGIIREEVFDEFKGFGNWLHIDKNEILWIGTVFHGIYKFDMKKGEITNLLNHRNLLPNDYTVGMFVEQSGNIWLQQPGIGSVIINPEEMTSRTSAPATLLTPRFNRYAYPVSQGWSKTLYTDGVGGFYSFHPDSIKPNTISPKVLLKSLQVNDSIFAFDYRPLDALSLSYNQNNIVFQYTGIHLNNPKRNKYAYRLVGQHDDWIDVGNQRIARFQGLPKGRYAFEVKAANSDGVWSEPVLLASFVIRPAWWNSLYSYVLYILILLSTIILFSRLQIKRNSLRHQADKLREVDQFKSKFFANISHEFRTPLTVILGLSKKIDVKIGNMIQRNAQQLLSLVNQLLELNKLETKVNKAEMINTDLVKFLNYLIESFKSHAESTSITLEFRPNIDELFIDFDKNKLQIIVNNLLSNAIKFTPPEGIIYFDLVDGNHEYSFIVIDSGIGIAPKKQQYIFDRYYQIKSDWQRHEGSGIGLSLSAELVKLLDGTISVQSTLGKGSEFTVTLPRTTKAERINLFEKTEALSNEFNGNDDAPESGRSELPLVLVIEDNQDIQYMIKAVLEHSYNIITAYNGQSGIEKAVEFIPDLIISDVMMPIKDGYEVCDFLKKDKRTSHMPIVLLTAKADSKSKIEGLRTGADEYLIKPFDEEELLIRIKNLIGIRDLLRQRFNQGISFSSEEKDYSLDDQFIKDIQSFILDHISESEISIADVCRELGISRTQLHRKLKALTNNSASLFIREVRINKSLDLLRNSQMNISEIAYAVGFSDPNYFAKIFREIYEKTPSEYRSEALEQ